jgi:lysophospholipase L1-like esterase
MAHLSLLALLAFGFVPADEKPLAGVRRVVFLGDSITYAGQYIEYVEAFVRARDPALRCEFLDLGLPSETVSGLSEPGHAGGRFPRPVLSERLDRVLARTKPDLIVACYGMNDGIYYPFSMERFRKYQEGITDLRSKAAAIGARVLHLTPPVFDPAPIRSKTLPAGLDEYRLPFEGYDDVLDRYSAWLLARKADGWDVVDLHGPLKRQLEDGHRRDPRFRLADDGVHLNAAGHWRIARSILAAWKYEVPDAGSGEEALSTLPHGRVVLGLVQKRQRLLKDAWLTDTGHKRPGMAPGLPLDEARRRGDEIEAEIRKNLGAKP